MRHERRGHRIGEHVAIHRQRRARRHLRRHRRTRITSEPARRSSACSRPTALPRQSSERNEFEHTSSAKPVGLVRVRHPRRAHFVQPDGYAGVRQRPGGLAAGEPAADDVRPGGIC